MVRLSSHVLTSPNQLCLAQWKFLHFHGQKTSRQSIGHSIYKDSGHWHTILTRVFSPILFFFPDAYMRELVKVGADGIVVEDLWKESLNKLVSEWSDFALYVCPFSLWDHARFDMGEYDRRQ